MSENIVGHSEQLSKLGHLVDQGRVPHLFLFAGPSGVGKKKVAFKLATLLGCNQGSTMFIEPDGANIKIDQAREVLEFCHLAHMERARMIIIDQVEKMNPQAANALLKIFEEPPPQTYFVLLAPSPYSVLTTIRSRAQILRFGSLSLAELRRVLPDTPEWILQSCGGRLDRAEALQDEDLLELRAQALEFLKLACSGQRADIVEQLKVVSPTRETALWLVKFWREFLRDVWFQKNDIGGIFHSDMSAELLEQLPFQESRLSELSESTQRLESAIHSNFDVQLALENYLVEYGQ